MSQGANLFSLAWRGGKRHLLTEITKASHHWHYTQCLGLNGPQIITAALRPPHGGQWKSARTWKPWHCNQWTVSGVEEKPEAGRWSHGDGEQRETTNAGGGKVLFMLTVTEAKLYRAPSYECVHCQRVGSDPSVHWSWLLCQISVSKATELQSVMTTGGYYLMSWRCRGNKHSWTKRNAAPQQYALLAFYSQECITSH